MLLPWRRRLSFLVGQVDVPREFRHGDAEIELLFQVLHISVDEVIRALVALMNGRIVHLEHPNARIAFVQRRQMRIVVPNRLGRSPHVRGEASGISPVQVPDGGGEHDDVSGLWNDLRMMFCVTGHSVRLRTL